MSLKEPKQERSRVMLRSILEATTQLLNRVSDAKLTTRGIAERAGVSIGSLYQYFQSADSILSAVLKDRVSRDVEEIWNVFEENAHLALEPRLEIVFQKLLETHVPLGRARTTLFKKVLSLQLVEFGKEKVEGLAQKMFHSLNQRGQLRADLNEEMAIYLLSRTVFSVTMSATIDHEKMASHQNELARELAHLIFLYLKPVN